MSEERIQTLEQKLAILDKIVKLGWALLAGAFALGAWATLLEIRTQAAGKSIDLLVSNQNAVLTWKAGLQASQFTAQEHNKYATEVQSNMNTQDKRLTRVEDGLISIKESLHEIKDAMGIVSKNGKE